MFESKPTYRIIRKFLLSIVNKDFLVFLSFLALSSAFWLILTLNETYEQEVNVPVQMVGVPQNVVLTTELQDTVKVTLRDKGYSLMAYLYGDVIRPVTVSFNVYANRQTGKGNVPMADFQRHLYSQLSTSTKIVSVKPDKLDFFFNFGQSKRVPVELAGTVDPGGSYYLARTSFWPDSVTVYASKEQLDTILAAPTEDLNIINFQDTVKRNVKLKKPIGVKVVPSEVRMVLYPDILTEKTVEVPVIAVNMPEGRVLRTFPSRVKVRYTCGSRMLNNINAQMFRVEADYLKIQQNPSEKCDLQLRTFSPMVMKAWLELSQVDYLIEQQ
ncbi:MAG: YbbR-like domain-containing protein [Prevotella sp.]|nr:YbbR-like domain-containing protein [Prevotella sp.]